MGGRGERLGVLLKLFGRSLGSPWEPLGAPWKALEGALGGRSARLEGSWAPRNAVEGLWGRLGGP